MILVKTAHGVVFQPLEHVILCCLTVTCRRGFLWKQESEMWVFEGVSRGLERTDRKTYLIKLHLSQVGWERKETE